MSNDVIISGYVSMDRIILVDNELRSGHTSIIKNKDNTKIFYGGCPINIAYALTKYNISNLPIIRVGKDYKEIGFYQFLKENSINIDGVSLVEDSYTSNCYLIEDATGNHVTVFYPGAMDNKYFIPMKPEWFKTAKLAVLTVGPLKDNLNFLKECRVNKIPLVFASKLDYSGFTKEFLIEVLLYSKYIFANQEEAKEITKLMGYNKITEIFNKGNAKVVVVTKGIQGSTIYSLENNEIIERNINILEVPNCVDTTGSGDSYISGFIYGLLNNYSLIECAKLGAVSSSFVIQKMGCNTNVPTEKELLKELSLNGGKL